MSSPTDSVPSDVTPVRAALSGQYEIHRELGRGGMGIVLLARDERLDRLVALKVAEVGGPDSARAAAVVAIPGPR